MYYFDWNPLFLKHFISCLYAYRNIGKDDKAIKVAKISKKREAESSFTISLVQLRLGIYAVESLCIVLVEPLKSRFFTNPGLFDIDHICRHACAIILIKKKFGFSLDLFCLDTLSSPVFVPEIIDKIACCYFRVPLK